MPRARLTPVLVATLILSPVAYRSSAAQAPAQPAAAVSGPSLTEAETALTASLRPRRRRA